MTGLMLPRHIAAQRKREAVANSIQRSAVNNLASDDFVTPAQVEAQLAELSEYIEQRRQAEPAYRLPRPLGWRVSVLMLTIPETTEGGLVMVDENREARAVSSPQGVVLHLADGAYQDRSRFMVGDSIMPWLAVGDRVLWKKYDVTMFQLGNGQRLGFMNDTQAYGVIDNGWNIPS